MSPVGRGPSARFVRAGSRARDPIFELERGGENFSVQGLGQVNRFYDEVAEHFSQREILRSVEKLLKKKTGASAGAKIDPLRLEAPITSAVFAATKKEFCSSKLFPSPVYQLSQLPPSWKHRASASDLRNRARVFQAKVPT